MRAISTPARRTSIITSLKAARPVTSHNRTCTTMTMAMAMATRRREGREERKEGEVGDKWALDQGEVG